MDTKGTLWRAISTIVVWFMVMGSIALISIFLAPEIGSDVLGAIFMLVLAAILSNGFIWDWGQGVGLSRKDVQKRREMEEGLRDMALGIQKRKRENISSRLSDFSDAELMDLRARLQSGEIDEEELAYILRH